MPVPRYVCRLIVGFTFAHRLLPDLRLPFAAHVYCGSFGFCYRFIVRYTHATRGYHTPRFYTTIPLYLLRFTPRTLLYRFLYIATDYRTPYTYLRFLLPGLHGSCYTGSYLTPYTTLPHSTAPFLPRCSCRTLHLLDSAGSVIACIPTLHRITCVRARGSHAHLRWLRGLPLHTYAVCGLPPAARLFTHALHCARTFAYAHLPAAVTRAVVRGYTTLHGCRTRYALPPPGCRTHAARHATAFCRYTHFVVVGSG